MSSEDRDNRLGAPVYNAGHQAEDEDGRERSIPRSPVTVEEVRFLFSYPQLILAPQLLQNLEPGGNSAPHWLQKRPASTLAPQLLQNLEPAGISAEH